MILILKNQIILQENGQYLATLAPRSHLCFKEMRTCTTRQFSQCQTRSDVRRLVSSRKLLSPPKRTNRVLCPGLVIRPDKLRHIYQNEWRERSLSMEDSEMLVHPRYKDTRHGQAGKAAMFCRPKYKYLARNQCMQQSATGESAS